jgi:ribonuclease P protein component
VLAAGHRLRRSDDFRAVMRQGGKAGTPSVVVYLAQTGNAKSMAGFAVSRAVGGAVTRNLIKRRLRAIMAALLPTLPAGTGVAEFSFARLQRDVADAVARAQAKVFS